MESEGVGRLEVECLTESEHGRWQPFPLSVLVQGCEQGSRLTGQGPGQGKKGAQGEKRKEASLPGSYACRIGT